MQSKDIWAATVRIRCRSVSGTGVLIAARSSEIDYVLTALHNVDISDLATIQIETKSGDKLIVVDASISSDAKVDIAILHVEKYAHAKRIIICNEENNYAQACCVGYPGALLGKQREVVDYRGNISFDDSEDSLHFNIEFFPDPDLDKHDYITGFSGAGVFEFSVCKQYVKLKGIVIERWEKKFDVKKLACTRISVVAGIVEKLGLPQFANVSKNFSSVLDTPPRLLHTGLVKFVRSSPHVKKIRDLEADSVLQAITINMPAGGDLIRKFDSHSLKAQKQFIEEIFSAKSISFAYYNDSLKLLDLTSNPVFLESHLKIVLCCVTDDTKAPLIVCRLVTQEYKEYLKNALIVVCCLGESESGPQIISYPASLTTSVIENYTAVDSYLERSDVKDVKNYLQFDREEKRFSVFSAFSLCHEVHRWLDELYYHNRSGFDDDATFSKTIKDKLDETVRI